jgi:hypothetical protein
VPLSFALNVGGIFLNYSAHPSSWAAQKRVIFRHIDGTCFGSVDIDIHRQPLAHKHRPVSSEITREATAMSWVASARCLSFRTSLHSCLFHSFLLPSH